MRTFAATALIGPPFPARINRHATATAARSIAWATRIGLAPTDEDRRRLRRAEAGELAGRACPEADPEQLYLLADLVTWLFAFDDSCDEDGLGLDPARLSPVLARLLDVLDLLGTTAPAALLDAVGPAGRGLHDLCRRVRDRRQPELLLRFVDQVRDYLLALLWEATNRERHRVPAVAEYIQMRRHTGAVYPSFTLTDIAHDIPAAAHWRADPELSGLDKLAADLVCWCNDLFSYDKERRLTQDGHNLVAVIALSDGRDERLAMAEAVDRFNACLDSYLRLESRVLARNDPAVVRLVGARRCWIRGTYDWSMRAGRYH